MRALASLAAFDLDVPVALSEGRLGRQRRHDSEGRKEVENIEVGSIEGSEVMEIEGGGWRRRLAKT